MHVGPSREHADVICFHHEQIERVQNPQLWFPYQTHKSHMDSINPPETQNEQFLWHGTSAETVKNILNHGFNRSYCGKNGEPPLIGLSELTALIQLLLTMWCC